MVAFDGNGLIRWALLYQLTLLNFFCQLVINLEYFIVHGNLVTYLILSTTRKPELQHQKKTTHKVNTESVLYVPIEGLL